MRFLFADFVNTTLSAGVTPTQTTISNRIHGTTRHPIRSSASLSPDRTS